MTLSMGWIPTPLTALQCVVIAVVAIVMLFAFDTIAMVICSEDNARVPPHTSFQSPSSISVAFLLEVAFVAFILVIVTDPSYLKMIADLSSSFDIPSRRLIVIFSMVGRRHHRCRFPPPVLIAPPRCPSHPPGIPPSVD
jgi:hypothetical protein